MLTIVIPKTEFYDEEKNIFIECKEEVLQLEHSLLSLSKLEMMYCKPFLSKDEKTHRETIDYVKCMTISQNVDPIIYLRVDTQIINSVNKYILAPMTATTITKDDKKNNEIITSEVIYSWMIQYNIPVQFEKWHLNRLLTLINVCNIKNQPAKKMTKQEVYAQNRTLNAARKKRHNTTG